MVKTTEKELEFAMPVKKQLEVMLADAPGELAKLTDILKQEHINIEAMNIQDANEYLLALYDVRSQTGRRVAPRDYYEAILKESAKYSMIRLITDNPDMALEALSKAGYKVKAQDVIGMVLDNTPGILNMVSRAFGDAGINISYTYGSGFSDSEAALFIFKVSDMEKALELFPDGTP
ncbi:MAG: amino acid-binding protein [Deltaproteobacteria bacterium]|nr:amino acid-binding protein [Deltaproteobacteria bacterium]